MSISKGNDNDDGFSMHTCKNFNTNLNSPHLSVIIYIQLNATEFLFRYFMRELIKKYIFLSNGKLISFVALKNIPKIYVYIYYTYSKPSVLSALIIRVLFMY